MHQKPPPTSMSPGWVVTLDGAAHLKADDTDQIVEHVIDRLRQLHNEGKPFLNTLIECSRNLCVTNEAKNGHDLVAAVKAGVGSCGDVYTVFIGLGLEVIEALQK